MKRIALFSIATIVGLIGSACERFPATQLPEHYQHKMHASNGEQHGAGAVEHGKAEAHPAEAVKH